MWLIIFGLFVSVAASQSSEYYAQGFDCTNKEYLWNISTTKVNDLVNESAIERKELKVQLIQETQDDSVEVHELKVTRTLIINQCGKANSAWSW